MEEKDQKFIEKCLKVFTEKPIHREQVDKFHGKLRDYCFVDVPSDELDSMWASAYRGEIKDYDNVKTIIKHDTNYIKSIQKYVNRKRNL